MLAFLRNENFSPQAPKQDESLPAKMAEEFSPQEEFHRFSF